ncbi:prepilin peptidase [Streptomyces amritsarensis]|uniref:Prepilin peptidase n=1 Tax=Streptomyces amritsarensis TaxID=681158 RepID=A0ABX3G2D6_9ACTN|nr:A24 family peptidase [Streptomyces amritsarensis]OLZ66070.1 prepilin peptidase [Streptomyces amritsarensis]
MGVVVIVLAAGYGAAAGLLLPRAAYRLSVAPGTPWRHSCPQGHRLRGWLGPARCRPPRPEPAPPGPGYAYGPGYAHGPEPAVPGPGPAAPGPVHAYGPRALLPAALTGAVCALIAAAVGVRPEAAAYAALAPLLVLLALVDRAVHRLPDVLTLPLAAGAAALLGIAALLPGSAGSWRLALLGGGALGAAYLVLHLINPAGMGLGDVKLALSLGVALGWYGWGVWASGAFLGLLYGALYGLTLLLRGSATRDQGFAFGPFMAVGALTGVLLGGFGA